MLTFTNLHPAAVGLWDTDGKHHVARGMGGTVTIEPDAQTLEIMRIYANGGAGTIASIDPPENADLPSISGTPTVGETLTADPGQWTGEPDFAFQWLRNGDPIEGAAGASYVLTEDDIDTLISVEVTATNAAGSDIEESEPIGPVAPGAT